METQDFKKILTNKVDNAICLWWFNVDQDTEWDQSAKSFLPRVMSDNKSMIYGMEQMLLMVACADDYVILRKMPESTVIENIKQIRKELPKIIILQGCKESDSISDFIISDSEMIQFIVDLAKNNDVYLVPYAVYSAEIKLAELTGTTLVGPKLSLAQWVNSKINSRHISKELGFCISEGYECRSLCDVENAIDILCSHKKDTNIVVKEPYGSSGKGFLKIKNSADILLIKYLANKKEKKKETFNVLLEKWYENKTDINYQFFISENEISKIILSYQFVMDGVYKGTKVISDEDDPIIPIVDKVIIEIGEFLQTKGYRGVCSIDALYVNNEIFIPIIEINGRFSLSSYISCLECLNDRCVVSQYYDLPSEITIECVQEHLIKHNIVYDKNNREGVLIYSFSYGNTKNRMFVLNIFSQNDNSYEKINSIICELQ